MKNVVLNIFCYDKNFDRITSGVPKKSLEQKYLGAQRLVLSKFL